MPEESAMSAAQAIANSLPGVVIKAPMGPRFDEVLTPEALSLIHI